MGGSLKKFRQKRKSKHGNNASPKQLKPCAK